MLLSMCSWVCFASTGTPAVVEVDIMVRSMGPISEVDMVIEIRFALDFAVMTRVTCITSAQWESICGQYFAASDNNTWQTHNLIVHLNLSNIRVSLGSRSNLTGFPLSPRPPQTYSMDCYFRQSWVDRRLAFVGAQDTLALSISMLAKIWKPDTYFYNGKQSYLHTITTPNKFVRLHQDGRVLYSSR